MLVLAGYIQTACPHHRTSGRDVLVRQNEKLHVEGFAQLLEALGTVGSAPRPLVDPPPAAQVVLLERGGEDFAARFARFVVVGDGVGYEDLVGAQDRQRRRQQEIVDRVGSVGGVVGERKGEAFRERFAVALAVLEDLVSGRLGDVVVPQQEDDLFGMGNLQPRRTQKQLAAAVVAALGIRRSVDDLLNHQVAVAVLGQLGVFNDLRQVCPVSVDVAGNHELAARWESHEVAISLRFVAVQFGGLTKYVRDGAWHGASYACFNSIKLGRMQTES